MLFVLATNSVGRSEALCDYLTPRVDDGDVVHAVNSQRGGDATTQEELDRGKDALSVVEDRLTGVVDVETYQIVRGNDPAEDILRFARERDADEFVMGIRERSSASKLLFGSVAENVLMNADRPMRVVPVPE